MRSAQPYLWLWKSQFSPLIYRVLTTAVALAIGFDSAPEPSSTGVLIKALAGTGIMVIFLVFDLAYYTRLAMRRPWLRVGVRVLGSWIIAISFLVRNGLAKALISAADANVRTLGEHRPRSVFNQRVEID